MADEKGDLPKKDFTVSRAQLRTLIEVAGPEAVAGALIQNGNADPTAAKDFTVSQPQLKALIEKAGPEAVSRALIQNGNSPGDFA